MARANELCEFGSITYALSIDSKNAITVAIEGLRQPVVSKILVGKREALVV